MLFVFSTAGLVVVNGETLEPTDSHIVQLYVDGNVLSVPSRASDVGTFLERNNIELAQEDKVEPAKDATIDRDNYRINIYRARPYLIRDGSREISTLSAQTSPRLVAEEAGLVLAQADKVEFSAPQQYELARVIDIARAKKVTLVVYGQPTELYTNTATLSELLAEVGVSPATDDEITPGLSAAITSGAVYSINRNGITVVTEEVAIEPETEYIQDNTLSFGSTVVRDPGEAGKRIVTYEVTLVNDVEVARKELTSVLVSQPRNRVVARGQAAVSVGADKESLMLQAGIDPSEFGAVDYIISRESGWCALKWQGQIGYCPSFYEEKFPGSESAGIGYGLCQSTPAKKMASAGDDWRTNALTQLKWCTGYARARYGSWTAAYEFWVVNHWSYEFWVVNHWR